MLLGVLIVLVVALLIGIWLTFSLLGMLVTLVVAAAIGYLADRIVPGELPYGWLGAIAAGLAGSWLGTALVGPVGPAIAGIRLIPALLGAIILAFLAQLVMRGVRRRGGRVQAT